MNEPSESSNASHATFEKPDPRPDQVLSLIRIQRQGEAIPVLLSILADQPQNLWAMRVLSECQTDTGNPAAGRQTARDAIGIDPNDSDAHIALGLAIQAGAKENGRVVSPLASDKAWRNQFRAALSSFTEARRINPLDARAAFFVADAHYRLKEYEEAAKTARSALAHAPQDIYLIRVTANALIQLKRPQEAEPLVQQALRLEPDTEYSQILAAEFHLLSGQIDQAERHAFDALRLDPTDATYRQLVIRVLRRRHVLYRIPAAIFDRLLNVRLDFLRYLSMACFVIGLIGCALINPHTGALPNLRLVFAGMLLFGAAFGFLSFYSSLLLLIIRGFWWAIFTCLILTRERGRLLVSRPSRIGAPIVVGILTPIAFAVVLIFGSLILPIDMQSPFAKAAFDWFRAFCWIGGSLAGMLAMPDPQPHRRVARMAAIGLALIGFVGMFTSHASTVTYAITGLALVIALIFAIMDRRTSG